MDHYHAHARQTSPPSPGVVRAAGPSAGDSTQIPTGELRPVAGTCFDFTAKGPAAHTIGERIADGVTDTAAEPSLSHVRMLQRVHTVVSEQCDSRRAVAAVDGGDWSGGYDHNFAIAGADNPAVLSLAAAASCPGSGRTLELYTNAPGVQVRQSAFCPEEQSVSGRRSKGVSARRSKGLSARRSKGLRDAAEGSLRHAGRNPLQKCCAAER